MRYLLSLISLTVAALCTSNGLAGDGPPILQPAAAAGDWPWWRGPSRDGISADRSVVTKWGPTENVVWATPIPGRGLSSPIVCGQRIFLTTADDKTHEQSILALER